MFRKSFLFILFVSFTYTLAYAQTPEPKKEGAVVRTMAWSFEGDGGYLGVQAVEVTKENFAKFGLRDVRGAAVEKVLDASPAQAAGLQTGDVIIKFNGEEITSVRKLTRLIGEVAADHQATLTVLRNGDSREITVTLAKRPMPKFGEGSFAMTVPGQTGRMRLPPMPDSPEMAPLPPMAELPLFRTYPGDDRDVLIFRGASGRRIGVSVTALTKQLGDHFGVTGGILVINVRENSPAAKAGLKAGDIITEVEGKEVKTDIDLIRAIGEKKAGDVQLTIVRGGNRQTISVTPEEVKGGLSGFFEAPEDGVIAPGQMRLIRPATPAAPMPLNELMFPGRVL